VTPSELTAAGIYLYGEEHWRSQLASMLGLNRTSVYRWSTGETPIPEMGAIAIRCLVESKRLRLELVGDHFENTIAQTEGLT